MLSGATHPSSHVPSLTIGCHDTSVRSIHHVPVLLCQCLNVPFAEVKDLLPQHGAALGLSSLLNGEVQKHHPPYEAKSHQEKAQLLRGQLPGRKESHLSLAVYHIPWLSTSRRGRQVHGAGWGGECVALTLAPESADLLVWLPFCCGGGGGGGQLAMWSKQSTTVIVLR